MKPKSKSQAKRFKAMGAPERTPLSDGMCAEDGHMICPLCGEPGGICVCGFRDAAKVRELARKVAALEQEVEQETGKLNAAAQQARDHWQEIERLRAAIREALKFERGDQWRAILVDALTKPEGE